MSLSGEGAVNSSTPAEKKLARLQEFILAQTEAIQDECSVDTLVDSVTADMEPIEGISVADPEDLARRAELAGRIKVLLEISKIII